MIVVDSSILIAIFFDEPEKSDFQRILASNNHFVMSAVNAHETAIVLRVRHGPDRVPELWEFLANTIEILPFNEVQAKAAADAYGRYGKGLGTRAKLNLADCAAYALATTLNAPLLFKGNDFPHTDIQAYPW
jgi:ribonuclease VapC